MEKGFNFRILIFWELVALLAGLLVFGAILWVFAPYTIVWYVLLFSLGSIYLFFASLYIPFYVCNLQVEVNSQVITVTSGAFIVRSRYQRRAQISVAARYHNLLAGLLGLCTLVLYSPGSTLIIPLLDIKKADEIACLIQKNHS